MTFLYFQLLVFLTWIGFLQKNVKTSEQRYLEIFLLFLLKPGQKKMFKNKADHFGSLF